MLPRNTEYMDVIFSPCPTDQAFDSSMFCSDGNALHPSTKTGSSSSFHPFKSHRNQNKTTSQQDRIHFWTKHQGIRFQHPFRFPSVAASLSQEHSTWRRQRSAGDRVTSVTWRLAPVRGSYRTIAAVLMPSGLGSAVASLDTAH